jgi:hypothetical protein
MVFVLSYIFVFEWITLQLENLYICLDSIFEPFEDLNFRKEETRNFLLSMQANKDQEIEMVRQYYIYVYKLYQISRIRSYKLELKNLSLRPKALVLIKGELALDKYELEILCEKERIPIKKQYIIQTKAYKILREREDQLIINNYWAFRLYFILDRIIKMSCPILSWEKRKYIIKLLQQKFLKIK